MKLPDRGTFFRVTLAALFSAAFPFLTAYLLDSELSPLLIILFPLIKIPLYALIRFSGRTDSGAPRALSRACSLFSKACSLASRTASLLFAFFLVVSVSIVPYSSYYLWLESLSRAEPGGSVSDVVTLLCSFFSTQFAGMFLTVDLIWPFLGMALAVTIFLAFLYQRLVFFLAVFFIIALSLLYLLFQERRPSAPLRRMAVYVGIVLLSLSLAILFTGSGKPKGSDFVDNGLYPFFRQALMDVFPQFPLLYEIPGYGYSFQETKKLGGKPILSPLDIFEVRGGEENPIYLRTRSYDYYDGRTWRISVSQQPSESTPDLVQSGAGDVEEVSVKLLTEYYSFLPHTLKTRRIRFEGRVPDNPTGSLEWGFVLKEPMRKNDRIFLQADSPSKPDAPSESDNQADSLYPADLGLFLEVPEDIPGTTRTLARRLGSNTPDPETILRRIESFLAANYAYDLEAEASAPSADFVNSFLFGQQKGYCVHFATSFTILARLNGIPARYVTGFLVYRSNPKEPTIVNGLASHAWPEVWIEGKGWITWEATPALNSAYYDQLEDLWITDLRIELDGLTTRQLRTFFGTVRAEGGEEPEGEPFAISGPLVFAAFGLIGLAVFLFLFFLARRLIQNHSIRKDTPSLLLLAERAVRVAEKAHLSPPRETGWIGWKDRVIEKMPRYSQSLGRMTGFILEAAYTGRPTPPRDLKYSRMLLKRIRRHFGKGGS